MTTSRSCVEPKARLLERFHVLRHRMRAQAEARASATAETAHGAPLDSVVIDG